ncbi:hypothetical protein [Catellatospora sp. NPDC049609]|uniref:TolB family protein n=1 Tax=Catellatospora sp. NPDC049609 TaxID=3155505 RepID=UPI00342DF405
MRRYIAPAVLACLATAFALLSAGCGNAAPAGAATWLPPSCATGLPDDGTPEPLPADRPVGRAALLYQLGHEAPIWLVTSTGERYAMPPLPPRPADSPAPDASRLPEPLPPEPPSRESVRDIRLSPDGRWLARAVHRNVELRDLTGTRVEQLPSSHHLHWSPDGRWLVLQREHGGDRLELLRYDLREGRVEERVQPVPNLTWHLLGVRDDGAVVLRGSRELVDGGGERNPSGVDESWLVLDRTGRELGRGTLPLRHRIGLPAGDTLIATRHAERGTDAVATVAYGLADGGPRWTVTHPPHRLGLLYGVAGNLGGVPVIMQSFERGSPDRADTVELYTVDPATGGTALACRIPARSHVVLPR